MRGNRIEKEKAEMVADLVDGIHIDQYGNVDYFGTTNNLYNIGYRKEQDTVIKHLLQRLYKQVDNVALSNRELIRYTALEYDIDLEADE